MVSTFPHGRPRDRGLLYGSRRTLLMVAAGAVAVAVGLGFLLAPDTVGGGLALTGGLVVAAVVLALAAAFLRSRSGAGRQGHTPWVGLVAEMPVPVLLARADDGAVIARSQALAALRAEPQADGLAAGENSFDTWLDNGKAIRRQLVEQGRVEGLGAGLRRADGSRAPVTISACKLETEAGAHLIVAFSGAGSGTGENADRQPPAPAQNREKLPFGLSRPELLANISHELRTPLNAIIGFSKMMEDRLFGELGAPQYSEYARDIHRSGQHLLRVINDILEYSSIEAGQTELDLQPVDIGAMAQWAVRNQGDEAAAAGHAISLQIDPALPALRADERYLRKCLVYLLSNAIKFTPAPGQITVRAGVLEDGSCRIAVADTGIGIAPDRLERALQPFAQAEHVLRRSYGGTGLGLAITKSLVELHGGSFSIVSTLGQGTEASMCFPAELMLPATAHPSSAA